MKTIINEIRNIKKELGTKMQSPASDGDIYELIDKVKKYYKIDLPIDYIEFLKLNDGLVFSGLFVYGSKTQKIVGYKDRFLLGLVEANKLWRENEENRQYVFFADDDLSLYGLNLNTLEYEELDRSSGDKLNTAASFTKILVNSINDRIEAAENEQ